MGLHTLELVICGIAVLKGVKGIELANSLMVPIQLIIVLSTFYWSLSREYADVGISFMFTPDWCKSSESVETAVSDSIHRVNRNLPFLLAMFANPKVYVEAACQNAFDTAAGMGMFSAYAAYFTRKTGAVRFGTFLPMINNLVR